MSRLRRCPSGSAVSLALAFAGCFSPTGSVRATTGLTDTSTSADPSTQTSVVDPTTSDDTTGTTDTSLTTGPITSTSGSSESGATTLADTPVCGNGTLEAFEECDDGPANGDTAPCRPDCTPAVCGDIFRCSTCTPVEECDDGNVLPSDGCSETCRIEGRLIFLTPSQWTGDVSLATADETCQELGAAHFAPGRNFIAWLSTSGQPIVGRIGNSTTPYRLPDGKQIAADTTALLGGTLEQPINQDASGTTIAGDTMCLPEFLVWTGSNPDGTDAEFTCTDWTAQTGSGWAGVFAWAGAEWTSFCSIACTSPLRLYCVETAP
jgi:cysteine-rich repeat protein